MSNECMINRIISTKEMCQLVGRSRNTLYRWMEKGVFPARKEVAGITVGWLESDYLQWLHDMQVTDK